MHLAKPAIDIGLSTNQVKVHDRFWRDQIGLPFDAVLPISDSQVQYRFNASGSIIKINGFANPLPEGKPGGYRELLIAWDLLADRINLTVPDGGALSLVPRGFDGIGQIAIRVAVRDLATHRRFYADALGLPEEAPGRFRAGDSLLLLEEDRTARPDAWLAGAGWRYITLQVFKADAAHAQALANGAQEAKPPIALGDVARFSIIRDPDGNAIELSQRASIVGNLDP